MSQCKRNKPKNAKNENESLKYLKQIGYCMGKTLGQGTYSRVCLAVLDANGMKRRFACKIINLKYSELEFVTKFLPRELNILATIDHPHIVSVSNIMEINNVLYIFMEYCSHGDLLEYIRKVGPFVQKKAKKYFGQLVDAVQYLHRLDIAHRDLKCENILLTRDYNVKLGDFGFARNCINAESGKNILSSTYCGSAAYAAPEILKGIPYDPKMYDIWSLGCILYIMLSASMPFDESNIQKMLKIQMEKPASHKNVCSKEKDSPHLTDLFSNILEPDISKRYTITDIANCQWFTESCSNVTSENEK